MWRNHSISCLEKLVFSSIIKRLQKKHNRNAAKGTAKKIGRNKVEVGKYVETPTGQNFPVRGRNEGRVATWKRVFWGSVGEAPSWHKLRKNEGNGKENDVK